MIGWGRERVAASGNERYDRNGRGANRCRGRRSIEGMERSADLAEPGTATGMIAAASVRLRTRCVTMMAGRCVGLDSAYAGPMNPLPCRHHAVVRARRVLEPQHSTRDEEECGKRRGELTPEPYPGAP